MKTEKLSPEQAEAEVAHWKSVWNMRCADTMLKLVKTKPTLTADDFRNAMIEQDCPPQIIAANAHSMFKSFAAQGYMRKEKTYILSRNASRVLPVYTSLKYKPENMPQVVEQPTHN